jgi:hypothetical protein
MQSGFSPEELTVGVSWPPLDLVTAIVPDSLALADLDVSRKTKVSAQAAAPSFSLHDKSLAENPPLSPSNSTV